MWKMGPRHDGFTQELRGKSLLPVRRDCPLRIAYPRFGLVRPFIAGMDASEGFRFSLRTYVFYLIAVFVTAWFGGYAPGAIACLITMAGLPLAVSSSVFGLASIDTEAGSILFIAIVSLLISKVAANAAARATKSFAPRNDELDKRVRSRTQDLAQAVEGLESEVARRTKSEEKLQTQLGRLNLLDQITRAIGERQDLNSIFQVVVRTLEDNLPIDFGCVCLYTPEAETLTVTCVGLHSEALAMELAMTEHAQIPVDQNGLSRVREWPSGLRTQSRSAEFPVSQAAVTGRIGLGSSRSATVGK